jgi:TPR repeat protein
MIFLRRRVHLQLTIFRGASHIFTIGGHKSVFERRLTDAISELQRMEESLSTSRAKKLSQRSVEELSMEELERLGRFYAVSDPAKAYQFWREAGARGSLLARHQEATFLHRGIGVRADIEAGKLKLEALCNENAYPPAMYELALLLVFDAEREKLQKRGRYKHKRQNAVANANAGAERVDSDASQGEDNMQTALRLLTEAAEAGYGPAQHNLGNLYTVGSYSAPPRAGNPCNPNDPGKQCYQGGTLTVEPNQQHALEWFEKAAAGGDPDSLFTLGVWHARGRDGVIARDDTRAFALFRESAALGNPKAMFNVGVAFMSGGGSAAVDNPSSSSSRDSQQYGRPLVGKDLKEARRWFQSAAQRGFAPACANLGNFYRLGLGGERSLQRASEVLREGANRGDEKCRILLKEVEVLQSEEKDESIG